MDWYKFAQNFNQYAIENLNEEWIDAFLTNPTHPDIIKHLPFDMENISEDNIKEVYRGLRRVWHPDVNKNYSEVAHELWNALDKVVSYLNNNRGNSSSFSEETFSRQPAQEKKPNVFEEVTVHSYKGESNPQEFYDKYQDISEIPFESVSIGRSELDIFFSSGNSIHALWENGGGGMWSRGNFSNLDDRNWVNFYRYSFDSAAKAVANQVMRLASAGVHVTGFSGSEKFYRKVKGHIEGLAHDLSSRSVSMGEVNWDRVGGGVNALGLREILSILNDTREKMVGIMKQYKAEYGGKLSNRRVPWGGQESSYMRERAYPIISTLKYFSAWVENVEQQKYEHMTEDSVKEQLVETLRRQMEKSEKEFPVKNPNNRSYQIVARFYADMDKVCKELIAQLS